MPSDLQMKAMNGIHRTMLKASFGKIGWNLLKMPVVELTTTGRKSGQARTVMLTSPWQEDGAYVVVASRGGDDKPPAWLLNLQANPQVEVSIGGGARQSWTAEVADADTRARLWPQLSAKHKNYAGYQRKTTREIPLVLLRPTG
jgi:deazaflavin-dependent oxidoreductase (nitroreductase family)